MKLLGLAPRLRTQVPPNPPSGASAASGKPPSLGRVWPRSEGVPFWRGPPLRGRRKQVPRRGPSGGPWKRAAACPVCGVGSRQSLASEARSSGTAATVNVVCITATRRWFLTTTMAGDVSRIPERTVTDAERRHPVAPCLRARNPSPRQRRPPAAADCSCPGPTTAWLTAGPRGT